MKLNKALGGTIMLRYSKSPLIRLKLLREAVFKPVRNLMCWLGLHKWIYCKVCTKVFADGDMMYETGRYCKCCNKTQYLEWSDWINIK